MRAPIVTFKRARQLRRTLSKPEAILWRYLRGRQLANLRFRRQHPIGPYILDFYCPAAKLCVEVDGSSHGFMQRALQDERRTQWLAEQGIQVLRFAAGDVLDAEALGGVIATIEKAAAPSTGFAGPPPP